MRYLLAATLLIVVQGLAGIAQAAAPARLLTAEDVNAIRYVADPQISPEGMWVAHTVTTSDVVKDEQVTHIWMSSWDGKRTLQLTNSEQGESAPRWSPDGKYLAFISARGEDESDQIWLLDRSGGEATSLTEFPGSVVDYDWSPDGRQLAVIVADKDPNEPGKDEKDKTPPPIVIDRFYFKEDGTGYMGTRRQHLYLFDISTGKAELLTPGNYDEGYPSWSPNGNEIAFMSKRGEDPDRSNEFGLYVIPARPGSIPRLVTNFEGSSGDSGWMSGPVWRPDGKEIAFIAAGDPKLIYYSLQHLALVSIDGGEPRNVTAALDRAVLMPRWTADGKSIYLLLEDDGNQQLAQVNPASGQIRRVLEGRRETLEYDLGVKGRLAVLDSTVDAPAEIHALEGRLERPLSHHNDEWLASVRLGKVDEISFPSRDGTLISGFVALPPDYVAGQKYPTILSIHGGPTAQFANSFSLSWQILAAQGYVIVGANPRGSSGRGQAFSTAIYADWGNKDTEDVLAAVDYIVEKEFADPQRLGVGGWSYGGILTNFVIAKDSRFKVATSGASISNILAGYGTDMYIREYELELGTPWQNLDVWLRNSYPFLHADRIKTPTLFMVGEKDLNVPALNSEQMYQALRSLGVDTKLVIYPGQFHGLSKPTYILDRMQRYIEWYGKYLK